MREIASDKYLSQKPCVLCSRGLCIEALNPPAEKTGKLFPKVSLAGELSPVDMLMYEAASRSIFPCRPLIVSSDTVYTGGAAVIFFEELLGKYFSLVLFCKSREEAESEAEGGAVKTAALQPMIRRLIDDLLLIPDEGFGLRDDVGMFPAMETAVRTVKDIAENSSFFDCRLFFDEGFSHERDFTFAGITLQNYMKAIALLMYCINELSQSRILSFGFFREGEETGIFFETHTDIRDIGVRSADELALRAPSVDTALMLCDYISACSGFKLSVHTFEDKRVSFKLIKNFTEAPETEFKCRDAYDGYGEYISHTVGLFDMFSSFKDKEEAKA